MRMRGLVGWLALQIAWGRSGNEGSQSGAFSTLAAQPLGRVLLLAVVIGLVAALRTLAAQPFGPWLLSVVAVGFLAFGAFCVFQARYRKV